MRSPATPVRILRCGLRAWTPTQDSAPATRHPPPVTHLRSNHNEITTNTVEPSSISVEMALTSGVTPNLIIE